MRRFMFSGGLVLTCCVAQAQFKNIQLDPGGSNNPTIAINHDNPENIVAASLPNNIYFTVDGGLSWKKSTIASPMSKLGNPELLSSAKGNIFFFHVSDPAGNQIVVQESNDGGETWGEEAAIGGSNPKNQLRQHAVVDRKGNFFIGWTQYDNYKSADTTCRSNILLSSSSNGKKWSKPVHISQTPGDCIDDSNTPIGAVPAVSTDGVKVFITWAHQNLLLLDRSFDGGKTWLTNDIPIVTQPNGWTINIPGIGACSNLPILVCDNTKNGKFSGALFTVWADQQNENDTDVWFIRSMNFGDNWAQPLRINDDEAGKHQFFPAMAIDPTSGFLYIAYYDRRNYDDLQTDVYLAYSIDAGAHFKNVKVSEKPFVSAPEINLGDHISISASHGVITPIWTRVEGGQTSTWTAVIKHEALEKVK